GLINEISELSRSDHPADEYYPAVLQRIIEALAAVGGAIWLIDEAGALRLSYQVKVNQNLLQSDSEDASRHGRLLSRLFARGQSELVPPGAFIGEDQAEGNPSPFLLVVSPLSSGKRSMGLIEIFQRPDSAPNIQRGYLRFLDQMAGLIGEWLKGHTLKQVSDRQQLWQQADHFARLVHDNLELRDTAYTIANEGRQVIECDRVSVAIKKGGHCKVIAISGQDTIESRSNIVSALNKLTTRVVAAGDPLWYDGSVEDLPPQLEEAIEDYVDLSHGRTVAVLPIRRPEKVVEGDVHSKQHVQREDASAREIIGALVIEQIESQLPSDLLRSRADLVYEHTARALANSLTHNNLFLMPLWRGLGRATWFFRGSALPKTVAILTLVAVAMLLLFLVRINHDLEANGTLQPVEQKQVFAHVDGEVEEVYVDHGTVVTAGQPLVKLRNRDLEIEITNLQGQLDETNEQIATLGAQIRQQADATERMRMQAQESESVVRKRALEQQIRLQWEKYTQLTRVSPIAGEVMTWDLQKNLRNRPVVTGQILVTVANTNSDWELELLMPEKRMKYLDEAFKRAGNEPLPVEYILVTDPSTTLKGTLHRSAMHGRAELDQTEGAVVKLRVKPEDASKLSKRPGAEVKADVVCGKRSAAFVWFHEVIEWIYANVVF
ncbi:MAG: efflux RND transporter periplasmic adaptor subunit, partial [Pirellulaceae bacterium]|nr:efflux RND transporter periplasmic adaptor subunit [Pirellulaceae bacterium]